MRQLAPTIEHIAKAYADVSRGLPGEIDPQLLARVTVGTHLLIALDVNYRDSPIDTATVATEFTSLLVNGYTGTAPVLDRTRSCRKGVEIQIPSTARTRSWVHRLV